MIQANDFRRQWEDLRQDSLAAMERVGASGWYVLGQEVAAFEKALAARWGAQHAVGVASGLDALEIGLRILGCKPGDRVLTTPVSAFATTLAIVKLGAVPVYVDTDQRGLIDLDRCADLLRRSPDIRFFVPVHLYGHSLNLDKLRQIVQSSGVQLIEDCAQSTGASFRGAPTGSVAHVTATSFYPTKNLGCMGDGGAILTNDAAHDKQARTLRFYGETVRYNHEYLGYNSRLDELQAALLLHAHLPRLNSWIERRRAIAAAYLNGLQNPAVTVHAPEQGSESAWHLFPVFVEPAKRDSFLAHLKESGVGTGIHYPKALPDQPAMQQVPYVAADDCATARRLCNSEVSIPIHPYLNDAEVEQIIHAVNSWR